LKELLSSSAGKGYTKILNSYLYPEKNITLNESLTVQKERYEFSYSILFNGVAANRQQAVNIVMAKFSITRSQAYRDINDAINLFGDITKSKKEGTRHLLTEKLFLLASKAEASGDLQTAEKCYGQIAKIEGLFDGTRVDMQIIYAKLHLPDIHFTNKPEVLKLPADENTMDIGYEEE
jgi:hypothetical protein